MAKGIRWWGPFYDGSGYAAAAREYVLALDNASYPIRISAHCFDAIPAQVAERGKLTSLEHRNTPYDVVVSQLTPDMAVAHYEEDKYNINYFAWETSLVHPIWVEALNKADEVWVPSQWNVESLKNSGVTSRITKIPHVANLARFNIGSDDQLMPFSAETYKLYSIFQWNDRKNPVSLLRSYFAAFTKKDNVTLVLKTYIRDGSSAEREAIAKYVQGIKSDMGLSYYPPIMLISDRLSDEQMVSLHKQMDCYVALPHAEGFGLTIMDAGLAGKPVISTGASGMMEFLTENTSFLVPAQESLVKGMSTFNSWYLGNGSWFDPNEVEASRLMRKAFEAPDEASAMGDRLKKHLDRLNPSRVANIIISRVQDI